MFPIIHGYICNLSISISQSFILNRNLSPPSLILRKRSLIFLAFLRLSKLSLDHVPDLRDGVILILDNLFLLREEKIRVEDVEEEV